ncbi:MAG: preprotein translocase subunit SecE [Cocleimonas sp.]
MATEAKSSIFDTIKLLVALVILFAGIAGFYYFAEESLLYRVLGLLALVGIAIGVSLTTLKGKNLVGFLGNSRTEVRKMVWPTRAETMQTTLMVFIMVVILAIFLWFIDMLLGAGVKALLSVGG